MNLFVSYWLRQLSFVIALKRKNALFWEGRKTDQETKRNKKNLYAENCKENITKE